MSTANPLVVTMTRDELLALIAEVLEKFLKQVLSPYYSLKEDGTIKVYTRDEVAKILNKHVNTITKYIKQGRLHASVFNGQYFINEKELKRFINNTAK